LQLLITGTFPASFARMPNEHRWTVLPTGREIKGVGDRLPGVPLREFPQGGAFPERRALIRNFVTHIEIVEDKAVLA